MAGDPTEGDGSTGAVGPRAPKVFCSYGSPDREVVTELATWLRQSGVDAWLDVWEVELGESFVTRIEEGLVEAELVLAFLSRASEARVWRNAEVQAAIARMVEEGIRVVPVLIDADAHVPMLLRSGSSVGIGERERLLEQIHGRSDKPVLGPPPERWSEEARRVIEKGFAAELDGRAPGVDEAATMEEALRRVLRDRVEWVEQEEVCLASLVAGAEEGSDLRLPLELLRGRARNVPVVLRFALAGTETVPEAPSPRPEGGRIVLATAGVEDAALLAQVGEACRMGLHHVAGDEGTLGERERGAFDPKLDLVAAATRSRLHEALGPGGGRPGAAVLVLAGRVREGGLCLCDAARAAVVVSAEQLAAALEPFASHLRLVVLLPVADEGAQGDVGVAIVDAALALHRRGFAAVVAPRVPLPEEALPGLAKELVGALLGDARTLPRSLEVAVGRASRWLRGQEGLTRLGLRLYARPGDGDDARPLVILPYRGLLSFEPEHERFYVGREEEIGQVVTRLRELEAQGQPRLLVLVGASGVGKSSLAKAGVVPRLVVGGGGWVDVITRPADELVEGLEERLAKIERGRPLVVVDQLEEAFADAGKRGEVAAYLRRLWSLARDEHGTAVVATLRIDSLGEIGEVRVDDADGLTLEQLVAGRHGLYVCHLGAKALRQVIEQPTRQVGLAFDEGLAERLCDEALAEPGALPMLEVALEHLWKARRGRRLLVSAYEGGLAGTLSRQANACVEGMPAEQREQAERILVRIATGPDVGVATWRRRTTVQALRPERAERRAAFEGALEALVRGRLVVTGEARAGQRAEGGEERGRGGDVPIELAHELLLRRWEALQVWIEKDKPKLLAIRDLERWVVEWKEHGRRLTAGQLAYVAGRLVDDGDDVSGPMRGLLEESRRAVNRRKWLGRGVVAAVGVVAVVMSVLGYVAVIRGDDALRQTGIAQEERDKAEAQTDLAERRLDQADRLTYRIGNKIDPLLERCPQARGLVKEIIEDLQAMQSQLGATDADLTVRLNEIASHLKRGDEALHTDNLEVARREYQAALQISEKAVQGFPWAVETQRGLSWSLNKLGKVEVQAGNLADARDLFRRSSDILEELAKADPSSVQAKRDLSISLDSLGGVEVQAGNLAGARDLFQRSLQQREELAKADPDSAQAKRDLSISLDSLGGVEVQAGNLAGARDLFQHSLQQREQLAKADPDSAQAKRDLSISLDNLGRVEVQASNLAGARDLFQRSFLLKEELAKADPGSAQAKRDLSVSLNDLGGVEVQAGNLAGARDLFRRSSDILEELAKADPSSAQAKRDLSVSLDSLGGVEVQAGNLAGARDLFQRSFLLKDELAKADPGSAQAKRDLSISLEKLGEVEVQAGNLAGARDLFRRSSDILEELAKADPDSAQAKRDLSVSLDDLGSVEEQAGDLASARELFQRSSDILDELAKADPGSAQAKRDLSVSLNKLGEVEVQAGNLAGARELFQRSFLLKDELGKADPGSAQAKRDLSISLEKLGEVEVQAGNLAGARELFQRSLQQREELAEANPTSAQAKRDVSVSLDKLGEVEVQAGNLAGARELFQRSLQQREELAEANPTSAVASFDVVLSHMRFVMLAAEGDDLEALREHLTTAKTRLDTMDANGQVAGHRHREAVQAMVDKAAAELAAVP